MENVIKKTLLQELDRKNKELAEKDKTIRQLQEENVRLKEQVTKLILTMPDCTQCVAVGCGE